MDAQTFKETLSHWASGVTVVTTLTGGDTPVGMTASAFSSVSLDPPLVLVCVAKSAFTHTALTETGAFAVHILRADQVDWGMRFAGMIPGLEDRFAGLTLTTAQTGCPILSDAASWADCKVKHAYDGGDHTIYVGEVVDAYAGVAGEPLLYYNRNWRGLHPQPLTE